MHVAILTFEGFNEIDSFVALNILGRVPGCRPELCGPTPTVCSGNGVTVSVADLERASNADAVLVGSGKLTRQIIRDKELMTRIRLHPKHQLVGSQCSGALILATLGLLQDQPVCTDNDTRPSLEDSGIEVLDRSFHCVENVATAGGCLASHYLATWVIWRLRDRKAAEDALRYVVPVGEEAAYINRALSVVEPYTQHGASAGS